MKLLKGLVTLVALASISSASAVSIAETVVSPVYTAAAMLEVTIVAPTAATAGTAVSIAAREEAVKVQGEIEVYDATGEITALLQAKLETLKKHDDLKGLSDEELIGLVDEVTTKVIAGEEIKK
jgi:Skp family chaperone for outer membrane proteins